MNAAAANLNGALLLNKHAGLSSFGMIELLQRDLCARWGMKRRDLPKIGHGGTLDPFATGLLVICVGNGVKLARYFLGSDKVYEGTIRFGETTIPGDPTAEISERAEHLPSSLEEVRKAAQAFTLQQYFQTPPMHSAKKKDGKPLYELARQGVEVEREPKLCEIRSFEVLDFTREGSIARSRFRVVCSSGTYIRTLSQDLGRSLGTVAMLDTLHRTASGRFTTDHALTFEQVAAAGAEGQEWDKLPCWIPFDRMLAGYPLAEATQEEALALMQGRQNVLFNILKRAQSPASDRVAIYHHESLVAVACRENEVWGIERVFTRDDTA